MVRQDGLGVIIDVLNAEGQYEAYSADYDAMSAVLDVATERLGRAWGAVSHMNHVADNAALRGTAEALDDDPPGALVYSRRLDRSHMIEPGRAGAYLALFSEIGFLLLATTLIGVLAGYWVDQQLGTLPIFVALISRALGHEHLHFRHWLATIISFSGVALVVSRLDGGPFVRGRSARIDGEGTHQLEYFALDAAGNQTQPATVTLRVDQNPPTAPSVTGPSGTTSDSTPDIQWSPSSDSASGVVAAARRTSSSCSIASPRSRPSTRPSRAANSQPAFRLVSRRTRCRACQQRSTKPEQQFHNDNPPIRLRVGAQLSVARDRCVTAVRIF